MTKDNGAKQLAERCAQAMWPRDRASQFMDIRLESMDEGKAVMSMEVKEHMLNGYAMCHGGYIFSLADDAFAYACNSQNQAAVASSCTIDFLLPSHEGEVLTATAECLHQSTRNGLYDVTVMNQNGQVVARFRGRSARLNKSIIPEEPDHA
ncbi:MAG: hydroxyphenylacetyl-CoA thioesterase PaaI [Gammaproteobacteria bacterium]